MTRLHVKYLLAGGGVAAFRAAEAIRQRDAGGSMMLIGQETTRPYHRPALSKHYLRGQMSREALFTAPIGWFSDRQIELHTGHRVAGIDVTRHSVVLDSGREVGFDQLLIATGASPVPLDVPGANLPNVFYLRSLEDADRLHARLHDGGPPASAGGAKHIAIIGAGRLGVELAASLTQLNAKVDLICPQATPWHPRLGDVAGRFIAAYLEQHGVTVHRGASVSRLEGDGRVQRVVLADGKSIAADLVIGAVGASANRQLLRGTPIRAEKAILTDAHCRTSVPFIYAAGDCAAVFDPVSGKHRLGQHWTTAQLTGRIAGENMAGGEAVYDQVPQFTSEAFDLGIRAIGHPRGVERRLIRGSTNLHAPAFVEIGATGDGRIAQVVAFGKGHDFAKLESLVREQVVINGLEELLKDPGTPL